jgi:hypothetical protein
MRDLHACHAVCVFTGKRILDFLQLKNKLQRVGLTMSSWPAILRGYPQGYGGYPQPLEFVRLITK